MARRAVVLTNQFLPAISRLSRRRSPTIERHVRLNDHGGLSPAGVHTRRDATTGTVTDVIIQQRAVVRHRRVRLVKGELA